jgi:membrane-bound serine protease (ClpP class)
VTSLHAWLAFIAGVLVVFAGFLIFGAALGISYIGLSVQVEEVIAVALLVIAGITLWLLYIGVKAQYKVVKTGKEALIGSKGVVTTALTPKGEIRIAGEFWQATTKDGTVPVGVDVQVLDLDGMFLVVKPAEQKA